MKQAQDRVCGGVLELANQTVVQEASDACVCHIGDRGAAYSNLSALLIGSPGGAHAAVKRLTTATITCKRFDYLDEKEVDRAAALALTALSTENGQRAFAEERIWLFGDGEFDPFLNGMSPTESTYLAFDREALNRALTGVYAMADYRPPHCAAGIDHPGHIGVELDFMRHCLEHVAWGDERFVALARDFFGSHLREWGILFAVVLRDKSTHPGLRYASFALDKFIACEAVTFRQSLPSLCVQRAFVD